MVRRFSFLAILFLTGFFPFSVFAAAPDAADTESSSASLEMIAERMKALSGSLAAIPEPPRLNQVIQIPNGAVSAEPQTTPDTKEIEQ